MHLVVSQKAKTKIILGYFLLHKQQQLKYNKKNYSEAFENGLLKIQKNPDHNSQYITYDLERDG